MMFTFNREIFLLSFLTFCGNVVISSDCDFFPDPFLIPLEMATGLSWPNDIITMRIIYSTVGRAIADILNISADG